MKIIQQKQRGLNQISQNNKRTSWIFFAWTTCFFRRRERKEEEERKHRQSQISTCPTIRFTLYRRGLYELLKVVAIA